MLFSLAIAVGITPQLLPAIVSTSLPSGTPQLAKRKVLVKRLVCIEDLGDIREYREPVPQNFIWRKQVRGAEFEQQLHERLKLAAQAKANALELAGTKATSELQKTAEAKDAEIQYASV